jgi:1-acyl-sn-glycerol-3-phosphate acyltransferase
MRWLNRAWRLFGTGIAIGLIFIGGGFLAIFVLAPLAWFPGQRTGRARRVIQRIFRVYIAALRLTGVIRLRMDGAAQLAAARGRLIVANHPSLLDVVLLMSLVPNAQCIVKHELWNHRFLGPLMRAAGYIRNDLAADDMIAACRAALDRGDCLIIFPEGTRSVPGARIGLRRGFANLALLTGAPIQPVCITCEPPILFKGEPWWRIPTRTPLFTVTVDGCLDPALYEGNGYRSLAARKLVRFLEAYYAERIHHA